MSYSGPSPYPEIDRIVPRQPAEVPCRTTGCEPFASDDPVRLFYETHKMDFVEHCVYCRRELRQQTIPASARYRGVEEEAYEPVT